MWFIQREIARRKEAGKRAHERGQVVTPMRWKPNWTGENGVEWLRKRRSIQNKCQTRARIRTYEVHAVALEGGKGVIKERSLKISHTGVNRVKQILGKVCRGMGTPTGLRRPHR